MHRMWAIKIPGIPVIIPMLPFKLFGLIKHDTIVHVHYILNFSMDIAIIVAKLKRAIINTEMHIDPLPTGPYGLFNPLYKKLIWKNILPLSNVVMCNTQDFVEIATGYNVPRSKCIIVPNGIDRTKFKRKCSTAIAQPVKILFVGRLGKQKNILRLIEAFSLLQKKYERLFYILWEKAKRGIELRHILE